MAKNIRRSLVFMRAIILGKQNTTLYIYLIVRHAVLRPESGVVKVLETLRYKWSSHGRSTEHATQPSPKVLSNARGRLNVKRLNAKG